MGEEEWRPDRTSAPEGWLGERRGTHAWTDPWGLGGSGESVPSIPPGQSGPGKPAGLPSQVLCPLTPPLGRVGPRGMGRRRGEEEEKQMVGGTLQDWRIRGSAEGVSPAHLGPGSLLGSRTWSSTLLSQRHSWAPPGPGA